MFIPSGNLSGLCLPPVYVAHASKLSYPKAKELGYSCTDSHLSLRAAPWIANPDTASLPHKTKHDPVASKSSQVQSQELSVGSLWCPEVMGRAVTAPATRGHLHLQHHVCVPGREKGRRSKDKRHATAESVPFYQGDSFPEASPNCCCLATRTGLRGYPL